MNFCMKIAKEVILKEVKKGSNNKNVTISPVSINAMLNTVALGSQGRTLEQMLSFLGSKSVMDLNFNSADMMDVLASNRGGDAKSKINGGGGGGPLISFVNGVWVDDRYVIKPTFDQTVKDVYKAEVKSANIAMQPDQVVKEANAWAKTATKGLIEQILKRGSLDASAPDKFPLAVLANALYFKGAWADKFTTKHTRNRDFHLLNGKTIEVPFMCESGYKYYGSFEDFKVLKMPYRSGNDNKEFSMYFILPHERRGLRKLLDKSDSITSLLHPHHFMLSDQWLEEFWIPKSKFSYDFEASQVMKDLGLQLPFMEDNRDFTEMVEMDSDTSLFVSRILHKSCIEINEEGTEAAAVTSIGVEGAAACWKPEIFVADHPFLFMIKEERSGHVLFTGAVLNPSLN